MPQKSPIGGKPAVSLPAEVLAAARGDFGAYKRLIWKRYVDARHLQALDALLMACARHVESGGAEGISHLIVEMPPRHSKTMNVSRFFPTWFLGRNPDARVILASYGATLAEKNSRYARKIVQMPIYQQIFPGVQLALDSRAAEAWDIAGHDGGLDAVGVGGGITGKGGAIISVDDPVKSREEAESPVYRDRVWDWFTDDLYTRREPGAALIIAMTRWVVDDLVGRLLRDQPEKWHVLRLPALAEDNDPIGRMVGEPLWKERFDLPALQETRAMLGEYAWTALYQQRPIPSEGGVFKRTNFRLIHTAPECVQTVRFWDLAMSERTSADFSAGVKMGGSADGRIVVLDVVRQRVAWDQLPALLADTALRDGPEVRIGFEQQGYMSRAGKVLAQDPRLHRYAIWGYGKDQDKLTNALPFGARVGLGLVDVMEAPWTGDYLDELCAFPRGAHDDQVDASAGAYEMLDGTETASGGLNHADDYQIGGDY
ncbi:MAG: phage terminase large subunit [Chloroflexi bacterium]|nr:phage terminase large subunit [Chloroflexota bacterium]